jgi:hypothetical protein
MLEVLSTYLITFITVFAGLSLIRVLIQFLRALLSNPPKPFTLNTKTLIYYGICLSFILTLLINKI